MTKVCTKCGINKDLSEYYNKSKTNNKKRAICKICENIQTSAYREQHKIWYKEYHKNWNIINKDRVDIQRKTYEINHKVERQKYIKEYKILNKTKIIEYEKNKRNSDINYKLRRNLRSRTLLALNGKNKSQSTLNLLGCTIQELKEHLESKFQPGMTWKNHGVHGWHIDHINPCSIFDLTDPVEQKQCFHYTNLQPLWAKDNLLKGNKVKTPEPNKDSGV